MTAIRRILFITILGVFLSLPILPKAYAATPWSGCFAPSSVPNSEEVATIQCLVPLFRNVALGVLQISAVVLFIMFVVGGFSFLTSAGNPKALEKARGTLTYAIIGIVVIVMAYLIIRLIGQFTGITNLDTFTIPDATL